MWDALLYAVNMFLLPLVNKEADLANNQAEQSQEENLNRDTTGRKKMALREMPAAAGKARSELTSHKPHGKI